MIAIGTEKTRMWHQRSSTLFRRSLMTTARTALAAFHHGSPLSFAAKMHPPSSVEQAIDRRQASCYDVGAISAMYMSGQHKSGHSFGSAARQATPPKDMCSQFES